MHGPRALAEHPGLEREVLAQLPDFEDGAGARGVRGGFIPLFRCCHCVTSIADRRPSASMLKQIDTMKIMVPGSAATHGLR